MNDEKTVPSPASPPIERSMAQRVRQAFALWWMEAVELSRCSWGITCANRWKVVWIALGVGALLICVMPYDQSLLTAILQDSEPAHTWAWHLSHWGNITFFNLGLVVILGGIACVRRSDFIRRLAIAVLLCSLFSGIVACTIRGLAGRARPGNGLAPGFYGPTLDKRKQSFPSGHTATAFGASIPVAVAVPPAGVPLLLISGGVAWSRMQKNCHHLSDVLASIALASFYGIPLGLAARRMRREQKTTI